MKILIRALLILVVCIAVLLVFVATTERGLKLIWQGLQPVMPPALSIESVEGRLTGPLVVTGLQFHNEDFGLELAYAELEWTPSRLLFGELRIDHLVLDNIRYKESGKSTPSDSGPLVLPESILLPMAIDVSQLLVKNLAIVDAAGAEALLVEKGEAGLSYRGRTLQLHWFLVQSTDFEISADGRLETAADYPLEALIDWRLSPPDYAEIQGRTALSGTLKDLRVTQTFNDTYPVTGNFLFTGLPGSPDLEAKISVNDLVLKSINDDLPVIGLRADIEARGPLHALALSGWLDIDSEQLPTVHANLLAALSTASIEFESLQLTVPAHETEMRISGPVRFDADTPVFDLHADWNRVRWPLVGAAQLESSTGRLHLHGSLDDYRIESRMNLVAEGYSDADLSVQGRGNRDALQVSRLDIETLQGHVQGTAMLAWQPRLEASIDIKADSLDPGVLFAEWPGRLDVQLKGRAEFASGGLVAQLPRLHVNGQLRDLPVRLEAQGGYQKETASIEKLELLSGSSIMKLSGSVGKRLDLDWHIDSPDLNSLHPAAAGRLAGDGHMSGTLAAPVGKATLSASGLRYRNDRLSKLELNAAVDITAATESRLELEIGKGLIQGATIDNLQLSAAGRPMQHSVQLTADSSLIKGQVKAGGQWQQNIWHFNLHKAEVGHTDFAPWLLTKPFRGRIGEDLMTAERSCWHSGKARLCMNGTFSADTREGEVELRELPLNYFAGLLPPGVEAQGTLELDAKIHQQGDQPAISRLRLDSQALALLFPAEGERPDLRIEASEARLNLHGSEQGTRLDATLQLDNQAQLSVDATVSGSEQAFLSRTLNGRARIAVPDIAFLDGLTTHISDARGSLQGDVRLDGSLQAPVVRGRISTGDAQLTLDQPGITLEQLHLTLEGLQDGTIAMNAEAHSGGGRLSVTGKSHLHTATPTAHFTVSGNDFLVMDTREATISAAPDLDLKLSGKQLDIEGQIGIPSATIRPGKLSESAVSVSPDQIIVREGEETSIVKGYQVTSRIRFILGDYVRFDGFGLKGRISGNLVARDQPGKPTTASGELAIHDGKYRAYGQNLDIRTGRLLFAGGPVTEPGLNIEAVRRPSPGILVGVRARGTLRRPDFSLFSEPSMSQSDQLSWLVLGRPLESDASADERNSMNQAAIMLGLGGGLALTEGYGEKLGIDEISIESDPSDETNQASLLVGKYLSPKLFVSYGVGIFEPVSTLRFRYALSSKWRLVGESSAERSSSDLFYVIEFGK